MPEFGWREPANCKRTPGHPARGRTNLSRQVSWLAGRYFCRAFPATSAPVAWVRQQLAAYSCGGSAGIAKSLTGFPLSFRTQPDSEEPRYLHL